MFLRKQRERCVRPSSGPGVRRQPLQIRPGGTAGDALVAERVFPLLLLSHRIMGFRSDGGMCPASQPGFVTLDMRSKAAFLIGKKL